MRGIGFETVAGIGGGYHRRNTLYLASEHAVDRNPVSDNSVNSPLVTAALQRSNKSRRTTSSVNVTLETVL